MFRTTLIIGALATVPTLATAQDVTFDGSATVGFSFSTVGDIPGLDVELMGYSIDFDGEIGLSPNFGVGLGFGYSTNNLSIDGLGGEINLDLISLSIEPVYRHESGAYIGAYYRMGDLDLALIGPLTLGADTSQYGVFGGYDFGNGHVEVFYGISDTEEDALLGGIGDLDITDYGISGAYQVSPELEVYASVLRTDIEAGGAELAITTYAIGADYDVGNGFGIYGSLGGSQFDLGGLGLPDASAIGVTLGASYDLRDAGAGVPVILSAEFSHTQVDLADLLGVEPTINRFALGVTIPFGNGGDILNSNTRTARGDYRSAAAAIFNSL